MSKRVMQQDLNKSKSINVKDFGAACNCRNITNCTIVAGSTNLICSSDSFLAEDVGKIVAIQGAGKAGGIFVSTIISFTNSSTVTVANAAITSVTDKVIDIGTSDIQALRDAIDFVKNMNELGNSYNIFFPKGTYFLWG